MKRLLLLLALSPVFGGFAAEKAPYQNPALSARERAIDLCSRLTLDEKAQLMLDEREEESLALLPWLTCFKPSIRASGKISI